ncbi:MAG TPA: hypothetical protein HPP77_11490 [Candidatus Hydrogenedentes bacterium]|nr:hypothetical protein [Candidatus Hydrogenedentota bacterium]HIJ74550.1 hypothetical protein [Candidatus Hydrogenedentota bacterium]
MMGFFPASDTNMGSGISPAGAQPDYGRRIKDLEYQVQRLMLLNQALWELMRERIEVADADLERKAYEVDMRDGVEDGRMTEVGLTCPSCGRVSSSKHWRCLYCGQEFEKPIMG